MTKHNQPSTTATTTNVDDIKTLISSNASFFDKLVEFIPARFYLPSNENKPWFQGLSKAAKASAKRQTIANLRAAKENRFDPEKSSKTTLDFLKASLEKNENDSSDDDDDEEEEEEEKADTTYEELQERMRRKMEELRGGRSRGEGYERRKMKRGEWEKKRNRRETGKKGKGKRKAKEVDEGEEKVNVEKEIEEASKGIEFGKVKLSASIDDAFNKKNKKRKLSKEEELKKSRELEAAKNDPEKGDIIKTQHAWKAATDRAMGVKVHDNPDRIQKSLENEKRKQKKSKETWQKRVETTANLQRSKQEKRKANINAKINTKKQAKIAKREKKFMRPGFEGRKEGFITGE